MINWLIVTAAADDDDDGDDDHGDDDDVALMCVQMSSKSSQPTERVPAYIQSLPEEPSDDQIVELAEVSEYKTAISSLLNDAEDLASLERYKNAVKQLLLPSHAHSDAE